MPWGCPSSLSYGTCGVGLLWVAEDLCTSQCAVLRGTLLSPGPSDWQRSGLQGSECLGTAALGGQDRVPLCCREILWVQRPGVPAPW